MDKPGEDTILVFTDESLDQICDKGGSGEWHLSPLRAGQCKWLVCTQNRHSTYHEGSHPTEPHKNGFLLGKISGLRKVPMVDSGYRWLIAISEYARISYPDLWEGGQKSHRFTSLEKLGISPLGVEWQPMPSSGEEPRQSGLRPTNPPPAMLTISEAKKGLALTFGVKPEAIEIMIRG